jgi:hypothetical protein
VSETLRKAQWGTNKTPTSLRYVFCLEDSVGEMCFAIFWGDFGVRFGLGALADGALEASSQMPRHLNSDAHEWSGKEVGARFRCGVFYLKDSVSGMCLAIFWGDFSVRFRPGGPMDGALGKSPLVAQSRFRPLVPQERWKCTPLKAQTAAFLGTPLR